MEKQGGPGVVRRRRRVVRVRHRRFTNFSIPIETHRVVLAEVTRRVREVKVVITGILASMPGRITLEQFLRNYRERVGMELPYQSLGFNDALSLLATFPDICTIATNVDMENPGPENTWIHLVREDQVFPIRIRAQADHLVKEDLLDE
ncbi:hypothetical protein ABEB36_006138 [Hypothenemus hampei]|uniref:HTH OST-type domain-containing protein n=1 Tax=Hypothenemus hampei TaxID=57062 RepID=A0ABD1F1W5_HYPHA